MGKQYNKAEKRVRRAHYLKRKKTLARTKKAAKATKAKAA